MAHKTQKTKIMEQQSNKSQKNSRAKEDNIRSAVANVTEAVATIVSRSTNDEFRQKCFSLVKVSNSSGLVSSLPSQLHSIAGRHMGVPLRADSPDKKFPQSSETATATDSRPATARQFDSLHTPTSQSTAADDITWDDDFGDFSAQDAIGSEGVSRTLESSQLLRNQENTGAAARSSSESVKSPEVSQAKSILEDEWFGEVLDSDPFFNES